MLRFAYADPPYLGMCKRYDHVHPDGRCWDDIETHRLLIERLAEYDGWALSLSSVSLQAVLPLCPRGVRVMAYCKSWASWKPGVHPVYAWEPVILKPGRKGRLRRSDGHSNVTNVDWLLTAARQQGFFGAKPDEFTWWVLASLNVLPSDEFHDLFPGSGAVTRAWDAWRNQLRLTA